MPRLAPLAAAVPAGLTAEANCEVEAALADCTRVRRGAFCDAGLDAEMAASGERCPVAALSAMLGASFEDVVRRRGRTEGGAAARPSSSIFISAGCEMRAAAMDTSMMPRWVGEERARCGMRVDEDRLAGDAVGDAAVSTA